MPLEPGEIFASWNRAKSFDSWNRAKKIMLNRLKKEMICKPCLVQAWLIGAGTLTIAILANILYYYRLTRQVRATHSQDLTQSYTTELNAIQAASDRRIASLNPRADYLRRKQAFDAKHGTH